jgi:hypothetical protein
MMTALTDRYVWAVLRALPRSQRTELEPEIRALVADAIEARSGQPAPDGGPAPTVSGAEATEAAEHAALAELGDPGLLAARYSEQPNYLIGPTFFPEWRRLLTLILPIVVPIVSIVVLAANLLSGNTVGQAITAGIGTAITVTLQTLFWVTLVFAVIERAAGHESIKSKPWTVDDLPELPDDGRISVVDAVSTVIANVVVVAAILWVQLQPPIVLDGQPFPLFDPSLWSFWLPYFIVVSVVEIVFTIVLYMRGRWTWTFAVINAALGAAFAIPVVWLLQNDLLLNPALVAEVGTATDGTWLDVTGIVIGVTVVVIVAGDAIDGFRKAAAMARR